ncbi:hypothetical protein [Streptomyces olindensis]|uniref:hypothetical protein n=1 Tax=Streptomyces olindensis TaxID=358823 RepID=UPI0033EC59A2
MRMTEPFASTVAAVAPVIWLVGAVEVHQMLKYMREHTEAGRLWAERLAAESQDADDATVAALDLKPPEQAKALGYQGLFAVWLTLSVVLTISTTRALNWLAQEKRTPDQALAAFCYDSILWGMVTVVLFPMAVAAIRMLPSEWHQTKSLRVVKRRRARARARLAAQASGDDDSGAEGR